MLAIINKVVVIQFGLTLDQDKHFWNRNHD